MEAKPIQDLIVKLTFAFVLFAILAASPMVRGQDVLDQTTLGKSQNDERDLQNSLTAGPQRYGKGDKKSEIKTAELKSKSIKDSTFGGSLLNVGIDSSIPKLDESKTHKAPGDDGKQSTASKQPSAASEAKESAEGQGQRSEDSGQRSAGNGKGADASAEAAESQATFSNLSTTATLGDNLARIDADAAAAAAGESKTSSKATTTAADTAKKNQAGATSSSADKSASSKPDGDR